MDYITCNQKKNKPRVGIVVCGKCRRRRGCPDYRNYLQPLLFPLDSLKGKIPTEAIYRRFKQKRMKPEVTQIPDKPKQLALDMPYPL